MNSRLIRNILVASMVMLFGISQVSAQSKDVTKGNETLTKAMTQTDPAKRQDGINKAKEKGVKFGAQRKLTDGQIKKLREKRNTGILIKNLMEEYRLSKASVYRYLEAKTEKSEE